MFKFHLVLGFKGILLSASPEPRGLLRLTTDIWETFPFTIHILITFTCSSDLLLPCLAITGCCPPPPPFSLLILLTNAKIYLHPLTFSSPHQSCVSSLLHLLQNLLSAKNKHSSHHYESFPVLLLPTALFLMHTRVSSSSSSLTSPRAPCHRPHPALILPHDWLL